MREWLANNKGRVISTGCWEVAGISLKSILTLLWAYAYNESVPRPKKYRCINCRPDANYFKPRGIPLVDLEEISLTRDEIEAISLADYEELYHEEAAMKMKISRQTFGRILNGARKKVAECLIRGKALKIETK